MDYKKFIAWTRKNNLPFPDPLKGDVITADIKDGRGMQIIHWGHAIPEPSIAEINSVTEPELEESKEVDMWNVILSSELYSVVVKIIKEMHPSYTDAEVKKYFIDSKKK